METNITKSSDYKQWLGDLKLRIRQSQIKAAVKVNRELLRLYWDLGHDIVARQMDAAWGSSFFAQLSKALMAEFPEMKGFSETNLKYCKYFYRFYSQEVVIRQQAVDELQNPIPQQAVAQLQIVENNNALIRQQVADELQISENNNALIRQQVADELESPIPQQPAAELQTAENSNVLIRQQAADELENHPIFQIPWFHHVLLISKCKSVHEALFYVSKTLENGWSRAMLMNFLDTSLYQRQGKSLNNFARLLPAVQSDLANETLKNPYNFDFLALSEKYKERELENALIANITRFLLELGKGFAFVGKQPHLQAGSKDLFVDMLFYHLELRCYVAVELKVCEFDAAFTGQLGAYVSTVNHQLRKPTDNPTIGLLICKSKDNVLAQYSLESSSQPIGISEYNISQLLPDDFKSSLPSIEEIEEELKGFTPPFPSRS
ncbi:MAG: PDDEXK nuclease domain-containing protein [Prevotellaceae bacterium]|jgi:predicted nuclease of restriction endonuclease-like (RecB) superfamily|nr:PDDEXK nuclease domain-containing protein [Prevotellaceae bacterium]